jgi:hypothetical protein
VFAGQAQASMGINQSFFAITHIFSTRLFPKHADYSGLDLTIGFPLLNLS